eukprot:NODE_13877_length_1141_cov_7.179487.p1 GENE.NODE_13877_length_1141_cov_7.179487~~NODE_13877_length_1141_cov_7.179487.p1  ORF type:complete len:288 (-),score=93.52 NODE_13877_length_1141_cov_7.179487:278-1045(-)
MMHSIIGSMLAEGSDDEYDERPSVRFGFRMSGGSAEVDPGQCSAVVVCAAGAAEAFADSSLRLRRVAWSLTAMDDVEVRRFPAAPKSPRFFTSPAGNVALALLAEPVPPELADAWVDALLAAFHAAKAFIVLDAAPRASWRSSEPPDEPHLCGLWTSAWEGPPPVDGITVLPAPNAVEGLAASLLTCCEMERKRCLVALTLQDGLMVSGAALRAFHALLPLLLQLGLAPEDWAPPQDYREVVRKMLRPVGVAIYT